ncbi:MAG TPA: methyltransferase [Povalibacter sp.]|nr:methyltransferase [Povalibacter sp.]
MHELPDTLSIAPPRYGVLGALLGKALFNCRRLTGRHRYDRFAIEWVQGLPFIIIPGVFNPRVLRTGAFFASQLDTDLVTSETRVLDMGTGSGVCAVVAAKRARRVVAVDINAAAARCARINALANHVEDRVDVRHGDLFAPVAGERFDLILFNPPFIRGVPKDARDCAWRSPDAVQRFAAALTQHLNPGGYALVLLSTFGDAADFAREFAASGLQVAPFAEREYINERISILKVTAGSVAP